MEKQFTLNKENYYTNDANKNYLSNSLYKRFEEDASMTMAELYGLTPKREETTPLLVGNYIHSYFESPEAHNAFVQEHEEQIYTGKGDKKKLRLDFQRAEELIEKLESYKGFEVYKKGDKEVIVTGEIGGVNWRGKIDSLDVENGIFYDLKTLADPLAKNYNAKFNSRETNVFNYGYLLQARIYQELLKQTYGKDFSFILFLTQKVGPSKKAMVIPYTLKATDQVNEFLDFEFEELKENSKQIMKYINGEEVPEPPLRYKIEFNLLNEILSDDDIKELEN